jgi:uncharacterized protein (TIGR02246 family)
MDNHEVLAVLDGIYNAWADNDADAFAGWFTEDATSARPGSISEDRASLRERMAQGFAGPFKGSRVLDEVQSVRLLGTDAAVVISRSGVLLAGHEAVPADTWVLATWVMTRQQGRWLIAAYHNCPAAP